MSQATERPDTIRGQSRPPSSEPGSVPIATVEPAPAFRVEPAAPAEWLDAFRLLFAHLPPPQGELRAVTAHTLVLRKELEAEGIFVARGPDGLLGVLVCVPLPGASGLVWPPNTADGPQQAVVEDQLLQTGLTFLRQRGARLIQALPAREEVQRAAPLTRHGFAHTTTLVYLRRELLNADAPLPAPSRRLAYQPYSSGPAGLFEETLLRTYEQTLDCPELNGVRDVQEIIAGHKAQGVFDPERWWLVLEAGKPVGVLLLTEVPEWRGWDLAYLGVVPEARGRGLGQQLTMRAIRAARAAGAGQLTLAVDARNRPAWDLYARLGFVPFEHREVYLHFVCRPAQA